jgi:uncharacterized protein (DUF362 family)
MGKHVAFHVIIFLNNYFRRIFMNSVSLLKHSSYEKNLKEKINESIVLVNGYEGISHGDTVLIKPNFVTARPAESCVNTHPLFIKALAELLYERGAKIQIGDSPAVMKGSDVAKKLGLLELLSPYNAKFIDFTGAVTPKFSNNSSQNFHFKQIKLASEIFEVDHLINAAKLKSHAQMGVTLCTKNLFGCVTGHRKTQWHYHTGRDLDIFAQLLIEIALASNAKLHLLDGIWAMAGNGPTNGYKIEPNVILASKNSLSLDRVVLEIVNKNPNVFPMFRAAEKMGLHDSINLSNIKILGSMPEESRLESFEMPKLKNLKFTNNALIQKLIASFVDQKMTVDHTSCIKCKKCIDQCPAKAMTLSDKVIINHNICIRCCCCQEICPVGALALKDSTIGNLFSK